MEDIQLILSIASIVAGTIIGVSGLWWANRIAKKSRVFDQPELDILIDDYSLILNKKIKDIIFGFSVDEKNIILCPINFIVANNGSLSAKNVHVRLVFPLILRRGGFPEDIIKDYILTGIYDKKELKRKTHVKNGFEYVDYLIPEITPRTGAQIQELIDISSASGMTHDVEVEFKDKIKKMMRTSIEWLSTIEVEISATDINIEKGSFGVHAYKVTTKEELIDKVMKMRTDLLREQLQKTNAPEKFISQLYAPPPKDDVMFVFPILKQLPSSDNKKRAERIYIEDKSEKWFIKS